MEHEVLKAYYESVIKRLNNITNKLSSVDEDLKVLTSNLKSVAVIDDSVVGVSQIKEMEEKLKLTNKNNEELKIKLKDNIRNI